RSATPRGREHHSALTRESGVPSPAGTFNPTARRADKLHRVSLASESLAHHSMRASLSVSAAGLLLAFSISVRAQDVKRASPLTKPRASTDVPATLPLKFVGPPTTGAITPLDLMTRLYKFADDSMMGRLAGTKWNDMGTDYIASEVKRLGLQPAGDNGGYFQSPLIQKVFEASSYVAVGGKRYALWKDFAPRPQGNTLAELANTPAVFGGEWGDTTSFIPAAQAEGKVVVIRLPKGPDGRRDHSTVDRNKLTARFSSAAAIAVSEMDYLPAGYIEQNYAEPVPSLKEDPSSSVRKPAYFYVTDAVADEMLGTAIEGAKSGAVGRAVSARILVNTNTAPGRNVLAILPGADPLLRNQYVVLGAHDDHIGFNQRPVDHDSIKALMMHAAPQGADGPDPKPTPEQWVKIRATIDSLRKLHPSRPDSIYNGADDDGSGSMALLEIAERFATATTKPKRSVIFAWHVGEEEGMLGSGFFTDHPTVKRDSIVAELNIDMIGRGKGTDATGENKEGKLLHGG